MGCWFSAISMLGRTCAGLSLSEEGVCSLPATLRIIWLWGHIPHFPCQRGSPLDSPFRKFQRDSRLVDASCLLAARSGGIAPGLRCLGWAAGFRLFRCWAGLVPGCRCQKRVSVPSRPPSGLFGCGGTSPTPLAREGSPPDSQFRRNQEISRLVDASCLLAARSGGIAPGLRCLGWVAGFRPY
jgi:hypothetical protein